MNKFIPTGIEVTESIDSVNHYVVPDKEANMAKVAPFHSKKPTDRPVHHDNNECTEGNNIERENKVSGTGGRPKCQHCSRLA